MPTCIKCQEEKEQTLFAKRGDRYRNVCRTCQSARQLRWQHENADKYKITRRKCYEKKMAERGPLEYKPRAPRPKMSDEERNESRRAQKRHYYLKNRERLKAKSKQYARDNQEKRSEYHAQWRAENADRKRQMDKGWRDSNKGIVGFNSMVRYMRKIRSQPSWLSPIQICQMQQFYEIAAGLRMQDGIPYHVDHIIPLKGKAVSGLHVPWNLQILLGGENQSKGNRVKNYDALYSLESIPAHAAQ